jgi:hypothetical protein
MTDSTPLNHPFFRKFLESRADEIDRLTSLRHRSILTEEEFEREKLRPRS